MVQCEPIGAKWGKAWQRGLGGEIKDKDKDKYRDKDKGKDKVQRGPYISIIFEKQGVQWYQIYQTRPFKNDPNLKMTQNQKWPKFKNDPNLKMTKIQK